MAAAELYAFWRIAERIGTGEFVVRRCLKRLERDELSIRAATEILWSYAGFAIRVCGSLEQLSRLTRGRPHNGGLKSSGDCDQAQCHGKDIVGSSPTNCLSHHEMKKSDPGSPAERYIVTPTYRGPDRRRRQRQFNPKSLLDPERPKGDSQSLWSMYLNAQTQESDDF